MNIDMGVLKCNVVMAEDREGRLCGMVCKTCDSLSTKMADGEGATVFAVVGFPISKRNKRSNC